MRLPLLRPPRLRPPRLRPVLAFILVLVAPIVIGVSDSFAASTTSHAAHPPALGGFGATLRAFAASHPRDAATGAGGPCPSSTCFGPVVESMFPTDQFSALDMERGRVVGYTEALTRGTPLLQAELEVAEMFPADATASQVTVVRRDQYGASCAVFDIQSKVLDHLFGKRAFGDDGGNIGVELATLRPSGLTSYNPRAIDLVIVMPTYADKSINC